MASIYDQQDAQNFIERINKLNPISQHIWGSMTVAQMLAHIQQPIRVALGEYKPKRTIIGILFGGMAKKGLVNDKPFKQGLPTDASFVIENDRNFEDEKTKAIELIQKLSAAGPGGVTKDKHPFFGKLSPDEWDALTVKHLDHHLRQFGV